MAVSNNERQLDQLGIIRDAINTALVNLQTCLPAIVEQVDLEKMTVTVQPAIQAQVRQADGSLVLMDLPLLQDVPIQFPSGGGCTMTFPIQKGDECQLHFSSRCIDLWWQNGGVQAPFESRKHDLSDAFAFFGAKSQPNVISNISADSVQVRSDDGAAFIELNPVSHEITLQGSKIKVVGDLDVTGNLSTTGTLTNNGKDVGSGHTHGKVMTGSSNTDVPN